MSYPRILIRDFMKGWNYSDLPAELSDDAVFSSQSQPGTGRALNERPAVADAQFSRLLNLFVNRLGRLRVRGGQKPLIPSQVSPLTGFTRFFTPTASKLVFVSNGSVKSLDETAMVQTNIGAVSAAARIDFASLYTQLFWCDGNNSWKWDGAAASSSLLGINPPLLACTATAGGAGNLSSDGPGNNPYQWYITYGEADGTESNPGPGSNALAAVHLQQVQLTNVPVSPNPAVTQRFVYRTGGTYSTYRLIGTISDNTSTTFNDNTADSALGSISLSFSHDPPPTGISFFASHKNRLVAAGDAANPFRVYFSTYGQPNYWPTNIVDPYNDGLYLDTSDPEVDNPIVGLDGVGSILIVACRESIYGVYGDTANDFAVRKICDTGCIARRSLVRCKNTLIYLSGDGMVYALDDTEPKPIALALRTLLAGVAASDMVNANAVYENQRYTLFIPQVGKAPINICYDFEAGSWTDVSDPLLAASDSYGRPNSSLVGQTLVATAAGYVDGTGTAYNGILSVFDDTATGSLDVIFETPQFEMGRPSFTKRAKGVKIEGKFTQGTGLPLALTVTASTPGRSDVVKTYPLVPSATEGRLLDIDLSPALCARRLAYKISGSVQALEINTLEFAYQYIRERA